MGRHGVWMTMARRNSIISPRMLATTPTPSTTNRINRVAIQRPLLGNMSTPTTLAIITVRRGHVRPADDCLELVAIEAAVVVRGGGGCRSVGSNGGAATSRGGCGGAGFGAGDGLSVAVGEDVEGVVGELEEGLLALADFVLFGGSHVAVQGSNVVDFGVCGKLSICCCSLFCEARMKGCLTGTA